MRCIIHEFIIHINIHTNKTSFMHKIVWMITLMIRFIPFWVYIISITIPLSIKINYILKHKLLSCMVIELNNDVQFHKQYMGLTVMFWINIIVTKTLNCLCSDAKVTLFRRIFRKTDLWHNHNLISPSALQNLQNAPKFTISGS